MERLHRIPPLVFFALEPYSYADAIGSVIAHLRPGLEVRVVEHKDLSAEIERREPAVVLSGREKPAGCAEEIRWAQFGPYEEPEVVRVDGVAESIPSLGLDDLLGLVDRLCPGPSQAAV